LNNLLLDAIALVDILSVGIILNDMPSVEVTLVDDLPNVILPNALAPLKANGNGGKFENILNATKCL
jgi:hypothetical protein